MNVSNIILQCDMDDMLDLLDLRQEVMERVKDVIMRVSQYQISFENYTHLWLDDRSEFLKQFLLYGQALTTEYVEAYEEAVDLPENPPTTDKFKEQVKLDIFHTFLNRHKDKCWFILLFVTD